MSSAGVMCAGRACFEETILRTSADQRPDGRSAAPPVRLLIFDLDGVIYRGETVLPHAAEAVAWARERGLAVRFMTNNSTVTRDDYSHRLGEFGIPTSPEHIMTSAYATALYLKSRGDVCGCVLVVGEGGLRDETAAAGFEVVLPPHTDGVCCVVVGMDRAFNYTTLQSAMSAILAGATFIASNRDPTFPVENGLLPGGGTIVAAIEAAVGFPPYLIGKPATRMLELVLEHVGCLPAETLMIGDRLDTNIKAGRAGGVRTALVLTGISSPDDVRCAPPDLRPDSIMNTLADLPGLLEERLA